MELPTTSTAPSTLERYRAAGAALSAVPTAVDDYRQLDDETLLIVNDECTALEKRLGAARALIAGEIAHRSRAELGHEGLAQRNGHRTPARFIKLTTGATKQQVGTALDAGALLAEMADDGRVDAVTGEILSPAHPWMRSVVAAVAAGSISISASQSIGSGLGEPTSTVTARHLAIAADGLVAEALAGVDADRLFRRARECRDELDTAGVALREEELHQQRNLWLTDLPNGMTRLTWLMDQETGALAREIFDRMVSPKRGGVRFVRADQLERAAAIKADERTAGQFASDGFLQLLLQGADADTSVMLGSGAPIIRITVAEEDLASAQRLSARGHAGHGLSAQGLSGQGFGRLEGFTGPRAVDAVSIDTVQRHLCTGQSIRIGFDPARSVLDVEREDRLFSKRQREVLAVKFGGCMDPTCERPPSWCEAHHVKHVARDGGKTEVHNGILLCRWHHLKYHREKWEIEQDAAGRYWLIPPRTVDPRQAPRPMPLKSAAMRDLDRVRRARASARASARATATG